MLGPEGNQMKGPLILLLMLAAIALFLPFPLTGADGVPKMTTVAPDTGKVGDVLEVEGEFLGKQYVADVFITDGTTDWKVKVLEQSDTKIKFQIPANAKPGRFNLMVMTTGKDPKLIEEPVRVTVEGATTTPS